MYLVPYLLSKSQVHLKTLKCPNFENVFYIRRGTLPTNRLGVKVINCRSIILKMLLLGFPSAPIDPQWY